jgi:hypothetical protein
MASYRAQASAETTKRLLAQLVNEGLVDTEFSIWSISAENSPLRITNKGDAMRSIQVTVIDRFESRSQWRPNDFEVPVVLKHCTNETEEDDPGSVWELFSPGSIAMAHEERNRRRAAQLDGHVRYVYLPFKRSNVN